MNIYLGGGKGLEEEDEEVNRYQSLCLPSSQSSLVVVVSHCNTYSRWVVAGRLDSN